MREKVGPKMIELRSVYKELAKLDELKPATKPRIGSKIAQKKYR